MKPMYLSINPDQTQTVMVSDEEQHPRQKIRCLNSQHNQ